MPSLRRRALSGRRPYTRPFHDAGWSSLVAHRAHNPKVAGSNPAPATNETVGSPTSASGFFTLWTSSGVSCRACVKPQATATCSSTRSDETTVSCVRIESIGSSRSTSRLSPSRLFASLSFVLQAHSRRLRLLADQRAVGARRERGRTGWSARSAARRSPAQSQGQGSTHTRIRTAIRARVELGIRCRGTSERRVSVAPEAVSKLCHILRMGRPDGSPAGAVGVRMVRSGEPTPSRGTRTAR